MVYSPNAMRAARALLGKTQEQIASGSGVERRVVLRLEKGKYLQLTEAGNVVRGYYEREGLKFLGEGGDNNVGVRWRISGSKDTNRRSQLYAARVLANLSQPELAEKTGIGRTALTRFENGRTRNPFISLIEAVRAALQAEGVEFLDETGSEGFGVLLKKAPSD